MNEIDLLDEIYTYSTTAGFIKISGFIVCPGPVDTLLPTQVRYVVLIN